jgi:hypothetical protein
MVGPGPLPSPPRGSAPKRGSSLPTLGGLAGPATRMSSRAAAADLGIRDADGGLLPQSPHPAPAEACSRASSICLNTGLVQRASSPRHSTSIKTDDAPDPVQAPRREFAPPAAVKMNPAIATKGSASTAHLPGLKSHHGPIPYLSNVFSVSRVC